jgi:hypothetical protein
LLQYRQMTSPGQQREQHRKSDENPPEGRRHGTNIFRDDFGEHEGRAV